jgi:hypothetical protein
MTTFGYAEHTKYFSLVQRDIEAGKPIKLGVAGRGKAKSVTPQRGVEWPKEIQFDAKEFEKLTKQNLSGDTLTRELKTKNNSYFTATDGTKYSFVHIFKGEYSGQIVKITTEQQERITLKIMEEVLSSKTIRYKSFTHMFDTPTSGVKNIFPKLKSSGEWWSHFELQFNTIDEYGPMKSAVYDVFSYTDFMSFITKIVTVDNKWYSQKDSWNPADIWLIKGARLREYTDAISKSEHIGEVNRILRIAYSRRHICGISLKKSDLKTLKFEEVNLELRPRQQELPEVQVTSIKLDCSFDNEKGERGKFTSKTSYLYVKEGQSGFKLAYKSNTGDKIGNITYEFLATQNASAFLGKVPKDRLAKMIKTFLAKDGVHGAKKMPQHQFLPKKWGKRAKKVWNAKVKIIQEEFPMSGNKYDIIGLNNFVDNVGLVYGDEDITANTATIMQMVEFTYILAMMQRKRDTKGENKLDEFATNCFYFAQKKGQKYDFGPFGKLY